MRGPLRNAALAALLIGAAAVSIPPSQAAPTPPAATLSASAAGLALTVETAQLAFGLNRPTAIAAPHDGSKRLFITEKIGRVRVYHPDTGLAPDPLIDISAEVSVSGNERGLLGIAVDPADNTLYLAYTRISDNAVTLARYRDGALEEVLTQEHATYSNHNGGQIAFDNDGLLFWGIGDGGSSGDPFDAGQRLDTLLGKILRLDVSCETYCVPADNPFVDTPGARPEIWAHGLRNPWRFSVDPADNSLWIADVGQGTLEEVDHLRAGDGGANLGWSCREGTAVFDPTRCRDGETYVDPVFTYQTSVEGCAVIGGPVYRGARFADIADGVFLASDYCTNPAFAIKANADGSYTSARVGELPIQPTSFGTDADGEIYLVNDLPGQLHKVSFRSTAQTATCTVAYRVVDQWAANFRAEVTVTNTGAEPVSGWSLAWSFADGQRAGTAWNARISQQGQAVTARNADWNAQIAPGAAVTFGFLGTRSGDATAPAAFTLNGGACR
ncbi:PQQ-dependent sugar dehydrogenase [Actinokineospora guangxiensis]|uniref:PQQ-dependent sugar dehydrogenase n=1 Tax=Actinokineospora guangxiensis TaxID=1490288 RepID=A0ABW0EUF8_9PSEU